MTLRGRPPLGLPLERIVEAVRQHRQIAAASRQLGCSSAYVFKRLELAGLSLRQVLDAPTLKELLKK